MLSYILIGSLVLGIIIAIIVMLITFYNKKIKWTSYQDWFYSGGNIVTLAKALELAKYNIVVNTNATIKQINAAISGLHIQVRDTITFTPPNTLNPNIKVYGYQEEDAIIVGSTLEALAHELWHRIEQLRGPDADPGHVRFEQNGVWSAIDKYEADLKQSYERCQISYLKELICSLGDEDWLTKISLESRIEKLENK